MNKISLGWFLLFLLAGASFIQAQPAPVWQTGQNACYNAGGEEVPCAGTGQDGEQGAGAAWPTTRFQTLGDCVTDNLTGLMWSRNANLPNGARTWQEALDYVAGLNSGAGLCGRNNWRLPNRKELRSLIDYSVVDPALPPGHPFLNVQFDHYWSSTTRMYNNSNSNQAWLIHLGDGNIFNYLKAQTSYYLWPVCDEISGPVGPVDHLAFSTVASPKAVNRTFHITVKAKDANENTVTGYNGTVTLGVSQGSVSPPRSI